LIPELEPRQSLSGHDAYCHVCWNPVYALWVAKDAPDYEQCAFGDYSAQTCPDALKRANMFADITKMMEARK